MSSNPTSNLYTLFGHRLVLQEEPADESRTTQDLTQEQLQSAALNADQEPSGAPLSQCAGLPQTLERTLKVRVAAADPQEAEFIDEILRAWQAESENAFALCEEMHRQGRPPDEILESVLDDISAEKADWPLAVGGRRRWRPQAPGVQAVREGAFMEWIETHGPEPKRYHSRVSCGSDDDTSKQIAPAASLHCSGTKPHQRRVQFRVSSTTEALISSDNSEIHLFMKDAGDRPIGTANTSGTLTLRFRVFSMGRKSIRRLMRDAAGNRSGVKHFGIAFANNATVPSSFHSSANESSRSHPPEYFFYLCYDGCEKRKPCETPSATRQTAHLKREPIDSSLA